MKQIPKLRVITRRDIPAGYQAVQASHAAIQFQHEHTQLASDWYNNSNYLVFLSVANLEELESFLDKVKSKGIIHSAFYEPDINNQLTAIALEPSEVAQKICSSLPIALKEFSSINPKTL